MKRSLKVGIFIASAVTILFWIWAITTIFPIPRGERVNPQYSTYYKNIRGTYYISVDNCLALFNHGHYGYLDNVDTKSFQVLADNWAKDKDHVWSCDCLVKEADAASFFIDKSGMPKDKDHVYVQVFLYDYRPTTCGIDVKTAEYFIPMYVTNVYQGFTKTEVKKEFIGMDHRWIRDKDDVYFNEEKVDVDRKTFKKLDNTIWWIDKDWIYIDGWDSAAEKAVFTRVDSVQKPIEILSDDCRYLRNGRNIIFYSKVLVKDQDITRFEQLGYDGCRVNDMTFEDGEIQNEK